MGSFGCLVSTKDGDDEVESGQSFWMGTPRVNEESAAWVLSPSLESACSQSSYKRSFTRASEYWKRWKETERNCVSKREKEKT